MLCYQLINLLNTYFLSPDQVNTIVVFCKYPRYSDGFHKRLDNSKSQDMKISFF